MWNICIINIIGIPPVLYLSMNKTIRNETRKMLLKFLCVDLDRLSQQTLAEFNRVSRIQNNNGDEEMIERPRQAQQSVKQTQQNVTQRQIVPVRSF